MKTIAKKITEAVSPIPTGNKLAKLEVDLSEARSAAVTAEQARDEAALATFDDPGDKKAAAALEKAETTLEAAQRHVRNLEAARCGLLSRKQSADERNSQRERDEARAAAIKAASALQSLGAELDAAFSAFVTAAAKLDAEYKATVARYGVQPLYDEHAQFKSRSRHLIGEKLHPIFGFGKKLGDADARFTGILPGADYFLRLVKLNDDKAA